MSGKSSSLSTYRPQTQKLQIKPNFHNAKQIGLNRMTSTSALESIRSDKEFPTAFKSHHENLYMNTPIPSQKYLVQNHSVKILQQH